MSILCAPSSRDHSENPDVFQECLEGFQYNLNIILQPEPESPKNQPAEPLEQPEEVLATEPDDDHTIDFQIESPTKDDSEEIILSSELTGYNLEDSLEDSPLSEPDPKVTEDAHQALELVIDDQDEVADAQEHHASFAPVIIDGLHPGQWVEFIGEGDSHHLRCKLARLSQDRRRYIFVNSSGMRVAERSGSELKKEIKDGSVCILEENPVFDRAIQAVLKRFKKHL